MPKRPINSINLNVRGMLASATVAINERSDELRAQGRTIYKLGLGQSPFPVPESVVQSLRDHAHEKDYLAVRGLRSLRDHVAAYHHRRNGIERSGDDVLIGPGSKELMFLLQLVYYGDLMIASPSWVSYAPQAQIIGRRVHRINTSKENGWAITPAEFEKVCGSDDDRPSILILNYPNNPTGGTYSVDQLEEIANIARDHGVLLLSDEIYGELHHLGEHTSISRFYPEGTIISAGLSKWCGAGGWRLGTFSFPPGLRWLLDAMAAAASETYTSTSAPIQYAAVTAYQESQEITDYLKHSRMVLRALGLLIAEKLRSVGLHCDDPQGGFYVFGDASSLERAANKASSAALCEQILEDTGVAVLPGSSFGRPDSEMTMRIAYVDFDGRAALEAVAALEGDVDESFLRAHCAGVTEAIDRLCDWFTK